MISLHPFFVSDIKLDVNILDVNIPSNGNDMFLFGFCFCCCTWYVYAVVIVGGCIATNHVCIIIVVVVDVVFSYLPSPEDGI